MLPHVTWTLFFASCFSSYIVLLILESLVPITVSTPPDRPLWEEHSPQLHQRHPLHSGPSSQNRRKLQVCHIPLKQWLSLSTWQFAPSIPVKWVCMWLTWSFAYCACWVWKNTVNSSCNFSKETLSVLVWDEDGKRESTASVSNLYKVSHSDHVIWKGLYPLYSWEG